MRSRIVVLIAALLGGVCIVLVAPPQVSLAELHRRVPATHNCLGIGSMGTGAHMWQDQHGGARSQLALGMQQLICSAADGSTIDIKSWFVTVSGTAMARIIADLRLMNRYHQVHVNVFVAHSWYVPWKWRAFQQAFSFAKIDSCLHACMSGVPRSIDHSKWITVSRLRARNGGGSAVLSTSLNPSPQQFASGQSAIVVLRNRPVYAAFIREWDAYNGCASGRGCQTEVPVGRWYGLGDTHVWFEPSQQDPTYNALHTLDCSHGGTIDLMSLYLYRTSITSQLQRLQRAGCTVNLLLEHASLDKRAMSLSPRCELNHDKVVIIDVGNVQEVIAGSQDQTPAEVTIDDNQMVRTTRAVVFRNYVAYFNQMFRSRWSAACPTG